MSREIDDTVYIRVGPEIVVAATKTYVSQIATLTMLVTHVGRLRDKLSSERASEILRNLRDLPGAVQQVLGEEHRVRAVAEQYADSEAFFFIGCKYGQSVALEGALKLKETSYDHAEGSPAGELKQGPLALVTDRSWVLAILTEGTNRTRR